MVKWFGKMGFHSPKFNFCMNMKIYSGNRNQREDIVVTTAAREAGGGWMILRSNPALRSTQPSLATGRWQMSSNGNIAKVKRRSAEETDQRPLICGLATYGLMASNRDQLRTRSSESSMGITLPFTTVTFAQLIFIHLPL